MITFILPYRPSNLERKNNFEYVNRYLKNNFPESEIVVADSPFTDFNRGAAINEGVKKAKNEILCFYDADMLVKKEFIEKAVTRVEDFSYVLPFTSVKYLDKKSSILVFEGQHNFDSHELTYAREWNFISRGGINILKKSNFIPFDTRFLGWGFEDSAFAVCMTTFHGPIGYIHNPAFHLWHEELCKTESLEYKRNAELFKRYEALEGKPDKLRRLLDDVQN